MAIGAPGPDSTQPYTGGANVQTEDPYSYFAWNNRPFVSGMELLQVPAASQAQMLRRYSIDDSALRVAAGQASIDPYDGDGLINASGGAVSGNFEDDATGQGAISRLDRFRAPFGHLLNPFLTAPTPATTVPDPNDPEQVKGIGSPNFHRLLDYLQVLRNSPRPRRCSARLTLMTI